MQKLNIDLVGEIKRTKIQKLEAEMKEVILTHEAGEIFVCPYCGYTGEKKNRKGSAKLFQNNNEFFFKCFSCGIWRAV